MVNLTLDALRFGAFYISVGNNGTHDTVTVNIGDKFSGTIAVDSMPADGEYDNTIINLPPGWSLRVVKLVEYRDTETPSYKDFSYEVINSDNVAIGTMSVRSNNVPGAPCFTRNTTIETEFGAMKVENLRPGMRVWTRDNGLQEVRWIGSRHLDAAALALLRQLKPIRIQAGALGKNTPTEDLLVSPQHRILVRSSIAQKMFGTDEVLVAAKQLLQVKGIDIAEDTFEVEYFHILFDRHEIVLSNGAETESLFTGPEAMKAIGSAARSEIFTIFPELKKLDFAPPSARMLTSGRQARKLAVRHVQNNRVLVS